MTTSDPETSKVPVSTASVAPPPKTQSFTGANGVDFVAQLMMAEFVRPTAEEGKWKRFVQFAKDVGPFFTSVASIATSIMIALVTVTVTGGVAYLTYQLNKKQAEASRLSLQTAALADFIEAEPKKRTVAALKLASYGKEAFPFIQVALGLEEPMRSGGVQTLQMMYQTQPENQEALLAETLMYFKHGTPALRLGALSFYSAIAPHLSDEQRRQFIEQLKSRLGPDASSCSKQTGAFVQEAVTFLAACPLSEVKQLLLEIARNCPHETTTSEYKGARIHAVNMLAEMIDKQGLPRNEREEITNALRTLKADASDELNRIIDGAITQIEQSKDQ